MRKVGGQGRRGIAVFARSNPKGVCLVQWVVVCDGGFIYVILGIRLISDFVGDALVRQWSFEIRMFSVGRSRV